MQGAEIRANSPEGFTHATYTSALRDRDGDEPAVSSTSTICLLPGVPDEASPSQSPPGNLSVSIYASLEE